MESVAKASVFAIQEQLWSTGPGPTVGVRFGLPGGVRLERWQFGPVLRHRHGFLCTSRREFGGVLAGRFSVHRPYRPAMGQRHSVHAMFRELVAIGGGPQTKSRIRLPATNVAACLAESGSGLERRWRPDSDGGCTGSGGWSGTKGGGGGAGPKPPDPPKKKRLTRFHASASVDAMRFGRDAGRIADEVLQHLTGHLNAQVEVTIEIQARLPSGANEKLVRDATENCRTLNFHRLRL